ncbi:L-threonylcarbamoyladenylate synthase [Flectobacillus longus]|uniref:L-threonylcarbamoyladenylate synthase n=1 Tax=Flectobacillus longus TaxID=2984207 RepID=UPI0024B6649C|nr:L-threonylcarbamoyladenylate synthase [Flectobacillus longus]MDI9882358.1 L-threonylcarbamoyladenylate synthase [Flectobacillus longus]
MILSTSIHLAKTYLEKGETIGLPTETVYGLAGNIWDTRAIAKIYEVKARPQSHPLIAHVANWHQVQELADDIPTIAKQLAEQFWPGPLTMILKASSKVPQEAVAGLSTIAIRMPDHPLALKLLSSLKFPLVAPSANPFGKVSPTSAMHVFSYFKGKIPLTLDGGNCEVGVESTIIGFDEDAIVIYRQGIIGKEDIQKAFPQIPVYYDNENSSKYPGSHRSHYSPQTPLVVTEDLKDTLKKYEGKKIGLLTLNAFEAEYPDIVIRYLSPNNSLKEAATHLYEYLHELDALGLDIIIAELLEPSEIGIVLNDRLIRASTSIV